MSKTKSMVAFLMGFVLLALLAVSAPLAWADSGRAALTTNGNDDKAVQQATTYKSSYALYKKDGYVYRCDSKGNAVSNGKLWSGSPDSYASVLFIDSNVTRIPEDGEVKYVLASNNKSISVYLKNIGKTKIVFKLNSKGKNACTTIGDDAFSNAKTKQYVNFNKTSVKTIGEDAFDYNQNLTSISFPSTLTKMGEWAFAGCSKLTSVTIPGSLKTIPSGAFTLCSALKTVTVKSGVKKIDSSAFAQCKNLTKADLASTVTSLSVNAFYNCSKLKTVYMRAGSKVSMPVWAFQNTPLATSTGAKNGAWFYVPSKLLSSYRSTGYSNDWRTYRTHFKAIPASSTNKTVAIYWLVHKKTGENLYTPAAKEAQTLKKGGKWTLKGIKWYAPTKGTAVYRLYNPKTGDHHYTKSANEVKELTKVRKTWKSDFNGKPVFYSGGKVKVYRLYSPSRWKANKAGTHRFETKTATVKSLKPKGWSDEGALLMASKAGNV